MTSKEEFPIPAHNKDSVSNGLHTLFTKLSDINADIDLPQNMPPYLFLMRGETRLYSPNPVEYYAGFTTALHSLDPKNLPEVEQRDIILTQIDRSKKKIRTHILTIIEQVEDYKDIKKIISDAQSILAKDEFEAFTQGFLDCITAVTIANVRQEAGKSKK